ncbi:MAG TPA: ribosome biogenesis GTPase Der [Candidatus Eisenbacteria bacterium]|nr:ribosome biogenesis GTPase Der [Candidatus Eisenbacteria bacterium]
MRSIPTAAGAPVIAIIGRPNVGKSTFFNRVLGTRRAVVHDRPGITRDRNAARTDWAGRTFVLVDTGGFLPGSAEARDAVVRRQAEQAIDLADAVIFLTDGRTGVTDLDSAIAQNLRKRSVPCLVAVNKVDRPDAPMAQEFFRLGLGEPMAISAENGTGIGDLLDAVLSLVPKRPAPPEDKAPRVAIIGRPNVGKSSLVNALLREDRVIVEPKPGTTMDPIDAPWATPVGPFVLVDTAGIRRQARFADDTEFYASMRALQALERADVACLVVDANEGFQAQDARLVQEAFDAGCAVLLVYNKWDLIEGRETRWKSLSEERSEQYPSLADLPALPISATKGTNLHRLPVQLLGLHEQTTRRIPTSQLNQFLTSVQRERQVPSNRLGREPRLYYMKQTGKRPPEFTVFVNAPDRLNASYRRFLWSRLTERFEFRGVPVRLRFRRSQ